MSLSPEYYRFRAALRAEHEAAVKPKIKAIPGCHIPSCDCGQKATIIVNPAYLESYADLEAMIVCLRTAAIHAWGPP